MKRILVGLAIVLAFPGSAATITTTTTASFDGFLARSMARMNRETCRYRSLPVGCTQRQAREVFCRSAGFGGVTTCTPNPASTPEAPLPDICTTTPLVSDCAGATQVDVYSDPAVFFSREAIRLIREEHAKKLASDVSAAEAAAKAGTPAQRDTYCAGIGLASGCLD